MKQFLKSGLPKWILDIALVVVFYAYTAHVKATTQDLLKDYIPRDQFQAYVKGHEDRNFEIIKRYDEDIREIKESLHEIRQELTKRPMGPPPRLQ